MNKERYDQIIDQVYENYKNWVVENTPNYDKMIRMLYSNQMIPHVKIFLTKDEFVNKIKTDTDYSNTFGLKIEETSLNEITLTYNNETIVVSE